MLKFLLRRIGLALLVALTVSVVCFSLLRVAGDIGVMLAGEDATPADIRATEQKYGLDQPLFVQYGKWVAGAVQGDLGRSITDNEDVFDGIVKRLPVTFKLSILSIGFAVFFGISLGILAGTYRGSWIDKLASVSAVFGQAIPNFWLGLVLIVYFGVKLRWFPISGSDQWSHFVMPTVALGSAVMPAFTRLARAGIIESLTSDYIRTARAKGLRDRNVLLIHALKNAILPIVSLTAVTLGYLMAGTVVTETVFNMNGIGNFVYQAILSRDFPVIQAIVLMMAMIYICFTLLADGINAWLDPRIRVS